MNDPDELTSRLPEPYPDKTPRDQYGLKNAVRVFWKTLGGELADLAFFGLCCFIAGATAGVVWTLCH